MCIIWQESLKSERYLKLIDLYRMIPRVVARIILNGFVNIVNNYILILLQTDALFGQSVL